VPEGDVLFAAAAKLRERIAGHDVVRVAGSHPALRPNGRRLQGHAVTDVQSVGKHLLVHFDHGWSLRTHLGMPGVWHVYRRDERWRRTPGKARVVLETEQHVAVCFSAPTVEVGPTPTVMASIDHLGPDLMADEVDWDEIARRAHVSAAETAADLLLDQTVMAGIGNVFKSEVLFLERVHPDTAAGRLEPETLRALAQRGRRLLLPNGRAGARTTTGERGPGRRTWVYGRAGRPCRRCSTTIASATHGDLDRVTYWCAACQPRHSE
jgi:endonuclease-8